MTSQAADPARQTLPQAHSMAAKNRFTRGSVCCQRQDPCVGRELRARMGACAEAPAAGPCLLRAILRLSCGRLICGPVH